MLTPINNLPAFVFGITASDTVTKDEINQILVPGLQRLVDQYNEIHYLLVLETSVGNFTAGSWLADMKAGLKNFTRWKKIAVVTDQHGVEIFTDVFSVLVPGKSKGYKLEQLQDAKEWISTRED